MFETVFDSADCDRDIVFDCARYFFDEKTCNTNRINQLYTSLISADSLPTPQRLFDVKSELALRNNFVSIFWKSSLVNRVQMAARLINQKSMLG